MSKVWRIEGSNGFQAQMPGNISESEMEAVLQRLVGQHLDGDEIIAASLRSNHRGYSPLLERIGSGSPIHFGQDPFYTARLVED